MDESGTRVAGVLPVAQLATCVLATALGFFYLVDALGDAPPSWPGLGLGALGVVATVLVWRSPADRNPIATYVGGILVPAAMLAVSGLGIFGVYALVVLVVTLIDVVRERVVAARR